MRMNDSNKKLPMKKTTDNLKRKVNAPPADCLMKSGPGDKASFADEISSGLSQKDKFIPSKYFYDKEGSELFERICDLPEYYLTKKEIEILSSFKDEFLAHLDGDYAVVELGSGSAIKTKHLFSILSPRQKRVHYYPIDISDVIRQSSRRLQDEFENLHVTGIIGQYEHGLEHVREVGGKKIIAFFGSSIGNFDQEHTADLLKKIHHSINPGDLFLLGLDLVKDKAVLESAYNDSGDVTARFNLNLLRRINDDLNGNFNLENFEHVSFYNSEEKRIEMHLKSKVRQRVNISGAGVSILLEKDETIRTEYSHKYTIPQIKKMAKTIGFDLKQIWTDEQNYFALALFSKSGRIA